MKGDRFKGYCNCGDHAWAVLTRGFVTLVSPEDAPLLIGVHWHTQRGQGKQTGPQRNIYAAREVNYERLLLHELVCPLAAGMEVRDHENGNGVDNRRHNVRACTHVQNHQNLTRLAVRRSSKYKGVSKNTWGRGWRAQINLDKRRRVVGVYSTEEEAARAYDAAAVAAYGDFAKTNQMLGLL